MSDSRQHLLELAAQYYVQSADAHAEGMELARQSARLEQLAGLLSSKDADHVFAELVRHGMVKIVDGVAILQAYKERSDDAEDVWSRITATGGKS